MGPIVDPPAARLDELAGADRCRMADDGDQIALAARLHPQDAEAAVLVVEGDPLDEAGEVLAFGCGRRRSHPGLTSLPPRPLDARSSPPGAYLPSFKIAGLSLFERRAASPRAF